MTNATTTLTRGPETLTFTVVGEDEIRIDHRYPHGFFPLVVGCGRFDIRRTRREARDRYRSAMAAGFVRS